MPELKSLCGNADLGRTCSAAHKGGILRIKRMPA